MNSAADSLQELADRAQDNAFRAPAVEISDKGRPVIPSRLRDHHGLEADDVIHLRIVTDDSSVWCFDRVLDDVGRVRIPRKQRKLHGLRDGDVVDLDVLPTGHKASEL